MKSISLINISFGYDGADVLFDNLGAVFRNSGCVAIVGDNGVGKSTLVKIITGELSPLSGRVMCDASVAVMAQSFWRDGKSGGEHQMDEIARVFNSGADILILDEPTNNLDADARAVFFGMLARYRGGVVIISHDRDVLRRVDAIWELSGGKLTLYGGNYDFYVAARDAARMRIESQYAQTQKRISELTRTVMVAQSTRASHEAKQKKDVANSRRSRLEANALRGKSQETEAAKRAVIQRKLEEQRRTQANLSAQMRDDTIKIPMPSKPFYSKDLIRVRDVCFGYGDVSVLNNANLTVYGGQKVHLVGPNGSGKSTLLKIIIGELKPERGTVETFGNIVYLNQDLSILNPNESVVQNIMNLGGEMYHGACAIAAAFGFRGDDTRKLVGTLSGGERLRAGLAAILGGVNQPDLLILDEPTNNLDIKSVGILESALGQYGGAVLMVSHDAEFVRAVADDWRRVDITDLAAAE